MSDFAVYIKDRPFNDLEYNVEDKNKTWIVRKFDFKTEIKIINSKSNFKITLIICHIISGLKVVGQKESL